LQLSPDADPAKVVAICSVTGYTNSQQWDKFATQKSAPVTLQAGQFYAFKTIHRQGTGGNLCDVAWSGPIGAAPVIIADPYLCGSMDKAYGPSPVDGAVDVNSVTLSWAGTCGSSTVSVYLGTDPGALLKIGETTTTSLGVGKVPGQLPYETQYYWRVDRGAVAGDVWTFKTDDGRPHFSVVKDAAALVTKTGTMAVMAWSLDPSKITYQWYKVSGDPNVGDAAVVGATGATLARGYPAPGDPNEGPYYCVASNLVGSTRSRDITFDGQTGLVHRYTFNDADVDVVVIKDVVGGSNHDGVLLDRTGKHRFQDGKLVLGNSGETSNQTKADGSPAGDYVDLPNGMISAVGLQMTIESWVTPMGTQNWQRVFDFGTSDEGEDKSSGASQAGNIFLVTKTSGSTGSLRFAYKKPAIPATETTPAVAAVERQVNPSPARPLPLNQEAVLTVVWDEVNGLAKLYYNGVIMGRNTLHMKLTDLTDNNNWIGRSQYNDPMLVGAINEFRIWDAALVADVIARHALMGPNDLSDPPTPGCTSSATRILADLNGDCAVDLIDYALMVEQWMMDVTALAP